MSRRRKPRRGVVLLIILSLLVLFLLLVASFLVAASQYRYAAEADARTALNGGDPRRLADSAMYMVVRDTYDPRSVAFGHSLLGDIWGFGGIRGKFSWVGKPGQKSAPPMTYDDATDGQIIEFELTGLTRVSDGAATTLDPTSGFYTGSVLTITSGKAANTSLRITSYQFDATTGVGTFRALRPRVESGVAVLPQFDDQCLLNGRPFSGTGFGYGRIWVGADGQPGIANTDDDGDMIVDNAAEMGAVGSDDGAVWTGPNLPYALLPYGHGRGVLTQDGNESYDAPDQHNMALAAELNPTGVLRTIPSFHRPDLVNYVYHRYLKPTMAAQLVPATGTIGSNEYDVHLWLFLLPFGPDGVAGTADDWPFSGISPPAALRNHIAAIKRMVIARPLLEDNPRFDGSNPEFVGTNMQEYARTNPGLNLYARNPFVDAFSQDPHPITQRVPRWDVDGDGDGERDSIWTDGGFPIQTAATGTLYKPLIAYKIVDLDGRFNLNAHGSPANVASRFTDPSPLAAGAASDLEQGLGMGPADIRLDVLVTDAAERSRLLYGKVTGGFYLHGRYGKTTAAGSGVPGESGQDLLSQVRNFQFANYYFDSQLQSNRGSFGSPFDLFGELRLGLDYRGQPIYSFPNAINTNMLADSPYELDLSAAAPRGVSRGFAHEIDQPFSIGELERLLRNQDPDASTLPNRLTGLAPKTFQTPASRRSVTTDSYDLPVPGVSVGYLQRVRAAMCASNGWNINALNSNQLSIINQAVKSFAPPELLEGTRWNLNRPFGNGSDDNGNEVVDEHWQDAPWSLNESSLDSTNPMVPNYEKIWSSISSVTIPFDHDNDGISGDTADTNAWQVRQHYARHLFILMMLLQNKFTDTDKNGTPTYEETAALYAQWAVNAVDFRDADAIMTPFEYDLYPFTGSSGPDAAWGIAGTDDDGNLVIDDASEAYWPGSDDQSPWSVDGYLGTADDDQSVYTHRRLVWGSERPELLLTEAHATHDLRLENLDSDPTDFEQRLRPRGAAIIELYNPSAALQERFPPEFYYYWDSSSAKWTYDSKSGVILNKTNGAGQPIWRIAVTANSYQGTEDAYIANTSLLNHLVYFTATGPAEGSATIHGTDVAGIAPIMPGRYGVLGTYRTFSDAANREGPKDSEDPFDGTLDSGNNEYVTVFGRRTTSVEGGPGDTLEKSKTRRLVLHPDADPDNNWVDIQYGSTADMDLITSLPFRKSDAAAMPAKVASVQPPVAVPMKNLQFSVNPSQPILDKDDAAFDPLLADGEGAFPSYVDSANAALPLGFASPEQRTVPRYKNLHLQRLANPLAPFHPITNPYMTVDSIPIDLTVYNGVSSTPQVPDSGIKFTSTERGETAAKSATAPPRNIWRHEPGDLGKGISASTVPSHIFDKAFGHSFGWLNRSYGNTLSASMVPAYYVGAPDTMNADTNFGGAIGTPFPWLTWPNRPFLSQYELMLVPWTSARGLSESYDEFANNAGVYDNTEAADFDHLLNFFNTSDGNGSIAGSDIYRLFEVTGVGSRFVETETWLPASLFYKVGYGTEGLYPPFNQVNNQREPGRININTLFNSSVWDGVASKLQTRASFNSLGNSRAGFLLASPREIHSATPPVAPTIFANPFRSPLAGGHVPAPIGGATSMAKAGVECTLLRSDTVQSDLSGTAQPPDTSNPLFSMVASTSAGNDATRNPFFRYQQLHRLGNLVTTRSNVYAIWITIGFFECDGQGRLGQELGSETGEVKRHRAFYVIDRSIPVGFDPGRNLNVDKAITLQRFIN